MFPQAVYFPIRTLYMTLKIEQRERYKSAELAAAIGKQVVSVELAAAISKQAVSVSFALTESVVLQAQHAGERTEAQQSGEWGADSVAACGVMVTQFAH